MINEANEPSSACRFWRIYPVETSTPPKLPHSNLAHWTDEVKQLWLLWLSLVELNIDT